MTIETATIKNLASIRLVIKSITLAFHYTVSLASDRHVHALDDLPHHTDPESSFGHKIIILIFKIKYVSMPLFHNIAQWNLLLLVNVK